MKPEAQTAKTVELNEDEKAVLKILQTAERIELADMLIHLIYRLKQVDAYLLSQIRHSFNNKTYSHITNKVF